MVMGWSRHESVERIWSNNVHIYEKKSNKICIFHESMLHLYLFQNEKVFHFNLNILVTFESFCLGTCYSKLKAFPSAD